MSNIPDNSQPDDDSRSGTSHDRSLLKVEIHVDPDVGESIDPLQLQTAVRSAAHHQKFHRGLVEVRITNDETIRALNRKHIGHDYATDVISFDHASMRPTLEGEMVVSEETARVRAREIGWSRESELVLYVVHGTLHITGMDDQTPLDRARMRHAEQQVMTGMGIADVVRFGADACQSPRAEDLA